MTFDLGFITRQKVQRGFPPTNAVGGIVSQQVINGVNYKVHEFTTTNVIVFQIVPGTCECLTIGGGGGGGITITGGGAASYRAGGGGAGGVITGTNFPVLPNVPYVVTVGAGGATGSPGSNGLDSSVAPPNFKGYSNYFDGSSDAVTIVGSGARVRSTGRFTIEGWYYPTSSSSAFRAVYSSGTGYATAGRLYQGHAVTGGATRLTFYWNSTQSIDGQIGWTLNTWNHWAVTWNGTITSIFINGQISTSSSAPVYSGTTDISLGEVTYTPQGYISNFRVQNTVTYTTNFIPAISPLTTTTNTVVLSAQDLIHKDNSVNNSTINVQGNVTIEYISPFSAFLIGARGGGGGGDANSMPGRSGGSGGGAGANSSNTPAQGGAAILIPVRQGNNGGQGGWQGLTAGGGGGGFTTAGGSGQAGTPGQGGAGISLDYNGSFRLYAGGGGATNGSDGAGGGNLPNRGGGGGSQTNGGSGVVIIRYPYTNPGP